jgi:cardiolipin hydrolase
LEVANKILVRQSVSEPKRKEIKSYFSPGEEGRDAIVAEINQARESIDICVFTISDNLIAEAIKNAHNRNVKVRIITDDDKTFDKGSDIFELRHAGLSIRTDNTRNHMHHKFAIVDRKLLVTGSYNWTRSAFKYNHENIMLVSDSNAVNSFCQEFDKLWDEFIEY